METASLADFWASWDLFRDAVLAGVAAGAVLGTLGVYIVLKRIVFLSAAVAQTATLGVALAFFVQVTFGVSAAIASPLAGAALTTLLAVGLLTRESTLSAERRDAVLGAVYLIGAAGTLAIGTRITQDLHDIDSLLLGSSVAVLPEDFIAVVVAAALILTLHAWWWKGFSSVSFDPVGARVRRLPVRVLNATLLVSLALAIAVCTRVIGALPTFALSVLPAFAVVRIAPNIPAALALAGAAGALAGFAGYLAAFLYRLPVGPAQTLAAALLTGLAAAPTLLRSRRRRTAA